LLREMSMTTNEDFPSDVIVRTILGPRTGDEEHQTADGRWWRNWDGQDRTGQEVKALYKP